MKNKTIIVSEKEFAKDKHVHQAKLGQLVDGEKIIEIIVVPEWVIQAIRGGRIK